MYWNSLNETVEPSVCQVKHIGSRRIRRDGDPKRGNKPSTPGATHMINTRHLKNPPAISEEERWEIYYKNQLMEVKQAFSAFCNHDTHLEPSHPAASFQRPFKMPCELYCALKRFIKWHRFKSKQLELIRQCNKDTQTAFKCCHYCIIGFTQKGITSKK